MVYRYNPIFGCLNPLLVVFPIGSPYNSLGFKVPGAGRPRSFGAPHLAAAVRGGDLRGAARMKSGDSWDGYLLKTMGIFLDNWGNPI